MKSRWVLSITLLGACLATATPAVAKWGAGPIAGYKAAKDMRGMIKRHKELKPVFKKVAKPYRRRALVKRVVGTAEAGVAATGAYLTFLAVTTANPPIAAGGTAVTCVSGCRAVKNFANAHTISKQGRRRGLEAAYLKARQIPELSVELRPGTVKYYDYHLGKKSNSLAAAAKRALAKKARIDEAIAVPQ